MKVLIRLKRSRYGRTDVYDHMPASMSSGRTYFRSAASTCGPARHHMVWDRFRAARSCGPREGPHVVFAATHVRRASGTYRSGTVSPGPHDTEEQL